MLSKLSTMRSMELMRCELSLLSSPSDTLVRNCAISISIRSVMPSYFFIRSNISSNSFSLALSRFGKMPYIRTTRCEKCSISFCADCMLSSAVLRYPPVMNFRRVSGSVSSAGVFTIQFTIFISKGMKKASITVFTTLNKVWNSVMARGNAAAIWLFGER